MRLDEHIVPTLLTAALFTGGLYGAAAAGLIPDLPLEDTEEINVSPQPQTEITWSNVSCNEHGTCVGDVHVDAPDDHTVVIRARTGISISENSTVDISRTLSDNKTVKAWSGSAGDVDAYAYEITEDGHVLLVAAYDFHEDGNVTEVEPEDPPLPTSRTSASESE